MPGLCFEFWPFRMLGVPTRCGVLWYWGPMVVLAGTEVLLSWNVVAGLLCLVLLKHDLQRYAPSRDTLIDGCIRLSCSTVVGVKSVAGH